MSEYINANELKERIEKELNTAYVFDKYDSGRRDTLNWMLYSVIAELSAADVAPVVHGHWENKYERYYIFFGTCSVCKHICQENNICGNCGAIMDESEG